MNDEDLLSRTFEQREALAPDPDAVWVVSAATSHADAVDPLGRSPSRR